MSRDGGPSGGGARAPGASGRRSDDLGQLVQRRDARPGAAEQVAEKGRVRPRAALVCRVTCEAEKGLDLAGRELERVPVDACPLRERVGLLREPVVHAAEANRSATPLSPSSSLK